MDNILWSIATVILAAVARLKAKLGIQPIGSRVVFVLCILTLAFILINENVAYVLSILSVTLGFYLGYLERTHIKNKENSNQEKIEKEIKNDDN